MTVIVLAACAGVVPLAPFATSVYVVVAVGFTCIDPEAATGFPFRVTVVAFCVCHVSVALCPGWRVVTVDVRDAEGTGAGGSGGVLKPPQPMSVKAKETVKTAKIEKLKRLPMARETSERPKWQIG